MSSRRRLRHAPPVKRHTTRDVWLAVAGALAVVAATLFAIWMLRPGGIADRQPRATWLVVLAVLAAIGYAWWLLGPRSGRREPLLAWFAGGLAAIAVLAVVAGFLWPGGLLRHSPPALDITDFEVPEDLPEDLRDDLGEDVGQLPDDTTDDTTGDTTGDTGTTVAPTTAPPATGPAETTGP